MDQRDTDRLAELFEHALTLSPDDRRRYAREACRDDPELCSELLSLLAAHDEAPGYLERLAHQLQPAALAPTHSFEPSESGIETRENLRVGERFGHFSIGVCAAAIFVVGAVWAVVYPERGLQDRIAGTYLVPR